MSETTADSPAQGETAAPPSFPEGFDFITYSLRATHDKFRMEALRAYYRESFPMSKDKGYERDRYAATVAPRDPEHGKYHVHFGWSVHKEHVDVTVEYHNGPVPHNEDECAPFAEDVMTWLSDYFTYESTHASCLISFTYPVKARESRFPLPMTIDVGVEAEIDGISVRLPSTPDGVTAVRFSQVSDEWYVSALAERRIVFSTFSPYEDTRAVASIVEGILKERRT